MFDRKKWAVFSESAGSVDQKDVGGACRKASIG